MARRECTSLGQIPNLIFVLSVHADLVRFQPRMFLEDCTLALSETGKKWVPAGQATANLQP